MEKKKIMRNSREHFKTTLKCCFSEQCFTSNKILFRGNVHVFLQLNFIYKKLNYKIFSPN